MRIGLGIGLNRFRGGQAGAAVVGLLDSYKGSAFAMSPDTLLYGSYSATDDVAGSVTNGDTGQLSVAILRDSDNSVRSFTPAEVADGTANTWVQAGVGGAANGFVRRGYDQSVTALNVSNLNHADQATTASMPKLFDSSTGLILENGKAAMEFDTNDILVFGDITFETVFAIAKISTIATINYIIFNGLPAELARGFFWGGSFSGITGIGVADGSAKSITNNELEQHIGYFNYDGVNWNVAVDNQGSTAFTGSNFSVNRLGRSLDNFSLRGLYSFCIGFDSDQSDNRNAISGLLNTEYNNIY